MSTLAGRLIPRNLPSVRPPSCQPFSAWATSITPRASPTPLSAFPASRVANLTRKTFISKASLRLNHTVPSGNSGPRDQNAKSGPGDAGVEPQMPAASLESLGIGRNMKVFLFVVLGVFGSIETWFWVKTFWIWWKGVNHEAEEVD